MHPRMSKSCTTSAYKLYRTRRTLSLGHAVYSALEQLLEQAVSHFMELQLL